MKHKYFNSLGKEVHYLADNESIFNASGIRLVKDCLSRSTSKYFFFY